MTPNQKEKCFQKAFTESREPHRHQIYSGISYSGEEEERGGGLGDLTDVRWWGEKWRDGDWGEGRKRRELQFPSLQPTTFWDPLWFACG